MTSYERPQLLHCPYCSESIEYQVRYKALDPHTQAERTRELLRHSRRAQALPSQPDDEREMVVYRPCNHAFPTEHIDPIVRCVDRGRPRTARCKDLIHAACATVETHPERFVNELEDQHDRS